MVNTATFLCSGSLTPISRVRSMNRLWNQRIGSTFLSLGGSLKEADASRDELCEKSVTLSAWLPKIDEKPALRKKVLSFVRDYQRALSDLESSLKGWRFLFLHLGGEACRKAHFSTRRHHSGASHGGWPRGGLTIRRVLPGSRKRMAAKNSEGATMAQEWVLVTRAWGMGD